MQTFLAPFRMFLRLPQPLRTLSWLITASWVISVITTFAAEPGDEGMGWVMLPFTVLMLLAGLVMASNFRGNASRMIELSREEGTMVFPLVFVRLLGAGVVAMGVLFIWLIVSGKG